MNLDIDAGQIGFVPDFSIPDEIQWFSHPTVPPYTHNRDSPESAKMDEKSKTYGRRKIA